MAELPDLDTTQVGFMAYWNAIDSGGVGSIDAEEALTDGNITSYTLYDNGFTAEYGQTSGNTSSDGIDNNFRSLNVRVKNDGWIVAYIDPSLTLGVPATGWFDFIVDTQRDVMDAARENNFTISPDILSQAVERLASNLSNYGSMTFNYSDVGFYSYLFPDCTNIFYGSFAEYNPDGGITNYSGVSYTSGTDLDFALCIGGMNAGGSTKFEGVTVSSQDSTGAIDLLAEGLIPDPDTEYQMRVSPNDGADGYGITLIGYH